MQRVSLIKGRPSVVFALAIKLSVEYFSQAAPRTEQNVSVKV